MKVCPKCEQPIIESYLTYNPEIETANICYNAKSKNCVKCEEPECELAGWKPESEDERE